MGRGKSDGSMKGVIADYYKKRTTANRQMKAKHAQAIASNKARRKKQRKQ